MKRLPIVLFILFFTGSALCEMDYASERMRMVKEQLAARDIKDRRVLDVMSAIERQKFVPETMKERAYEDAVIAIGAGETLAPPYSAALTAQTLQLSGKEKILEVGTGPGYQTAVLAELAKEVYTIDASEALRIEVEKRFEALGYKNIRIETAEADEGWPEYAPYDRIVVNDPILYIPQKLIDQLDVGGKLLIHIGDKDSVKSLLVEKEADSKLKKCTFTGTFFGPIVGEKPKEGAPEKASGETMKWKTVEGSKWKVRQ